MDSVTRFRLTAADADQLVQIAATVRSNPYLEGEGFVQEVHPAVGLLNLSIESGLRDFARDDKSVAVVISGVPTGMDGQTPTPATRTAQAPKSHFLSEAMLLGLSSLLGDPFAFVEENFGHIVQNVFPIREHAGLQISSNAVELTFHVDAGCHPAAPEYTGLLCLREPAGEKVATYFAPMREAISLLSDSERAILRQVRFLLQQEISYGDDQQAVPVAVWSTEQGRDVFRFDIPLAQGSDEESQQVVERLTDILLLIKKPVYLASGELLFLKNLESVHGRSAFRPRYDGADRWLQRVYICRDLRNLAPRLVGPRHVSALAVD
jgi:L-asparagine oxygenase